MTRDEANGWFLSQVQKYNAVKCNPNKVNRCPKNQAIWSETENFGWIWSAVDPKTNSRHILLKY